MTRWTTAVAMSLGMACSSEGYAGERSSMRMLADIDVEAASAATDGRRALDVSAVLSAARGVAPTVCRLAAESVTSSGWYRAGSDAPVTPLSSSAARSAVCSGVPGSATGTAVTKSAASCPVTHAFRIW